MNKRNKKDTSLWHRIKQAFPVKKGNLKVVTLCILAATTFWFFSALNKPDYTTRINYPITFSYRTDSTYLLNALPKSITLQVNGGGWNLVRRTLLVNAQPMEITLEEPTKTKFISGQSLAGEIERALRDVRLDNIVTDTLHIDIDSMLEKTVVVALDSTLINLEENHWLTSPVAIAPRTVTLRGPASIISQAADTLAVSLPDQNIDENYKATVPLSYINPMVEVIPQEANVQFAVAAFLPVNKRVPLTRLNFPKDSSAYLPQNQVNVSFWMRETLVENNPVDSAQFKVVANFAKVDPQDSTLVPMVSVYPPFARRITVRPNKLKVRYAP